MNHSASLGPVVATYSSPSGGHRFVLEPTLSAGTEQNSTMSAEEQTAYLRRLGRSISSLQADVNKFLTAKMDLERRLIDGDGGGHAASSTMDESKEEQNYGEEVDDES